MMRNTVKPGYSEAPEFWQPGRSREGGQTRLRYGCGHIVWSSSAASSDAAEGSPGRSSQPDILHRSASGHLCWHSSSCAVPVISPVARRHRSLPPRVWSTLAASPLRRDRETTGTGTDTHGAESASSHPEARLGATSRGTADPGTARPLGALWRRSGSRGCQRRGKVAERGGTTATRSLGAHVLWGGSPARSSTALHLGREDGAPASEGSGSDTGESSDGFCGGAPQNERHLQGLLARVHKFTDSTHLSGRALTSRRLGGRRAYARRRTTWPNKEPREGNAKSSPSVGNADWKTLIQKASKKFRAQTFWTTSESEAPTHGQHPEDSAREAASDGGARRGCCALPENGLVHKRSDDSPSQVHWATPSSRPMPSPQGLSHRFFPDDTSTDCGGVGEDGGSHSLEAPLPAMAGAAEAAAPKASVAAASTARAGAEADDGPVGGTVSTGELQASRSVDPVPSDSTLTDNGSGTTASESEPEFADSMGVEGADRHGKAGDSSQREGGESTKHHVWYSCSSSDTSLSEFAENDAESENEANGCAETHRTGRINLPGEEHLPNPGCSRTASAAEVMTHKKHTVWEDSCSSAESNAEL